MVDELVLVVVEELLLVVVDELVVVLVDVDELELVLVVVEVLVLDVDDELTVVLVEVVELVDEEVVDSAVVVVVVGGDGHGTAIAWRTSQTCASSRRSTPPAAPPKLTQYASSPTLSTSDAVSPGAGGSTSSGPSRPLKRALSLTVPAPLRFRATASTGPAPTLA